MHSYMNTTFECLRALLYLVILWKWGSKMKMKIISIMKHEVLVLMLTDLSHEMLVKERQTQKQGAFSTPAKYCILKSPVLNDP